MAEITGTGKIIIVPLANGVRIDFIARHPASGEVRRLDPVHQPTLQLARQYAAIYAERTGVEIEERLKAERS